jgi:hypothetical protein
METIVLKRAGGLLHKVAVVMAALVLVAVVGTGVASAHAHLESSLPADGATVGPEASKVAMAFSEELSVDQSHAELTSVDGSVVAGTKSEVDRAHRTSMFILTPVLPEGKYTVTWRAVTEDDNGITNGSFSFTVVGGGAMSGGGTSGGGASLPGTGAGDGGVLTVAGLALAALLVGAGALLNFAAKAR